MSEHVGQSSPMQPHERELRWPAWVPVAVAVPAVALAALTPFVHYEGVRGPALYLLLALAVAPWLLEAAGVRLGHVVFGVWVLVPIAALNWAGGVIGLDVQHDAQLSMMLLIWAVGCVTATARTSVSLAYTGAALLVPFGRYLILPTFEWWAFWAAGVLMAAVTGMALRRQQRLLSKLRAAQAALAEEAAGAERRRIAREVHDVIAHSLTVTMLHLTAARMAVRRAPEEAEEALAEAERLGRQALSDVRRTVGLLHAGEDGGIAAALPGAADVRDLVDGYATAGLDVALRCSADLDALSPAGGLALYRAVQESLANAARHAPGASVVISIADEPGHISLRVSDDGPGPRDGDARRGLGLQGMRERIEALGGTVTTGTEDSGWVVSCMIPAGDAPVHDQGDAPAHDQDDTPVEVQGDATAHVRGEAP